MVFTDFQLEKFRLLPGDVKKQLPDTLVTYTKEAWRNTTTSIGVAAKCDGKHMARLLSLERQFKVQSDFLGKFQQSRFKDAYMINYNSC